MLSFDPGQRITVPEALNHPWLASYHDISDEPDCPIPYTKWRDIEKLETIEEYREALWKEIEEYRREVRSLNIQLSDIPQARLSSVRREGSASQAASAERGTTLPSAPGIVVEGQASETESTTAVEESVTAKEDDKTLDVKKGDEKQDFPCTETVNPNGTVHSAESVTSALAPVLERKDSMRPPTPADMVNDPMVQFARRTSILQAQYLQQGGSASASPVRRAVAGMPAYDESHEYFSPPAAPPSQTGNAPSSGAPSIAGSHVGSIPFPSTGGGSYIYPARSRTGSTMSGDYASTWGPRKILRTLSTVSIHESVEGLAGGLAAMGPIGQAIIERRETAADAPPSEMPRDFEPLNEEIEERTGTETPESGNKRSSVIIGGSGNAAPASGSKKSTRSDGKGSTPSSAVEGKENGSGSGTGTPAKRRERRFIIF